MRHTLKPYIGITGFMSADEVKQVIEGVDFKTSGKLLMVGVLASLKTLGGQQNKWPNRYPVFDQIKDIFQDNENCLNLIHYNTKDVSLLLSQMVEVTAKAGPNFHGFQLNIAWPDLLVLEGYRHLNPGKVIVLQIGSGAFNQVSNSPTQLAQKVRHYIGLVDYVLLDPSGGLGQPFSPESIRDYLYELKKFEGQIGIGVAGGLSPSTLHLLQPLLEEYPNISIDAEGKLRTLQPEDTAPDLPRFSFP